MEFETPKDLLDFILNDCSEMDYYASKGTLGEYEKRVGFSNMNEIMIRQNFDMEKVFYAIKLLKEMFDITVEILQIFDGDFREFSDFIKFTELKVLKMYRGNNYCEEIPELPNTLTIIEIENYYNLKKIHKINGVDSQFSDDNMKIVLRGCQNLIELPTLPNSVQYLNIDYTSIEHLPNIPNKLNNISLYKTPIYKRLVDEFAVYGEDKVYLSSFGREQIEKYQDTLL